MQICLIPDEYTNDPATAFELGRRWGVEHYEIRYAYRWRVPVGPAWAADRVVAAVRDYGVSVTGISPGLFKPTMRTDGSMEPVSADKPEQVRRHLEELLPEFFAFAERLGTCNITVFALPKPPDARDPHPPQIVIDALGQAARQAEAAGFQLLLENGGGSWADSGRAAAGILEAVGSQALRLTWDPANVAYAGLDEDPVEEGYPAVRKFIANVHVKDVAVIDGSSVWEMLGDGMVDWPQQLRLLGADGYDGPVTAEPHLQYRPGANLNLVQRMEQFHVRLKEMLESR